MNIVLNLQFKFFYDLLDIFCKAPTVSFIEQPSERANETLREKIERELKLHFFPKLIASERKKEVRKKFLNFLSFLLSQCGSHSRSRSSFTLRFSLPNAAMKNRHTRRVFIRIAVGNVGAH